MGEPEQSALQRVTERHRMLQAGIRNLIHVLEEYPNKATFHADVVAKLRNVLNAGEEQKDG